MKNLYFHLPPPSPSMGIPIYNAETMPSEKCPCRYNLEGEKNHCFHNSGLFTATTLITYGSYDLYIMKNTHYRENHMMGQKNAHPVFDHVN